MVEALVVPRTAIVVLAVERATSLALRTDDAIRDRVFRQIPPSPDAVEQ